MTPKRLEELRKIAPHTDGGDLMLELIAEVERLQVGIMPSNHSWRRVYKNCNPKGHVIDQIDECVLCGETKESWNEPKETP
jgi:hypothetical protein